MAVVAAAEDPSVSSDHHGLLAPFDSSVDVTAELVDTLIDPVHFVGPENHCQAGQMDHVGLKNDHLGGPEALWDHKNDHLDREVDPLGLENDHLGDLVAIVSQNGYHLGGLVALLGLENDHQCDQVDFVEEESHHPVG